MTGWIKKILQDRIVQDDFQIKALPLGVGVALPPNRVKKIEDNRITASSRTNKQAIASKGRLGKFSGIVSITITSIAKVWCPSRQNARGSWLQVDLGLPYYVCSVSVQGNTAKRNEWVKRYTVSPYLTTEEPLRMSDKTEKSRYLCISGPFPRFSDRQGWSLTNFLASRAGLESHLHVTLPYRFVRFHPRNYNLYPCMGVEIYGYGPTNSINAGQQFNIDEIRAIGDPLAPYLLVPYSWKDRKDWRLAKYISQTGNDVQVNIITGPHSPLSFGSREVMLNVPPVPASIHTGRAVYAPFSLDKNGMKMYSIGRVGLAQNEKFLVTPICSKVQKSLPVGVGVLSGVLLDRINTIPNKQLTATSHLRSHDAKHGRLGNKKVWCAATNKLRTSRFQIDLGSSYYICSVAIQGQLEGQEYWVKSFKMAVSIDGRRWSFLRGTTGSDLFRRSGLNEAEISINLNSAYRYFSFNPITYYKHACMGVELYGVGRNTCELQNKCPKGTQCIAGDILGTYTCKCTEGYMSSAGGPAIRPGTDEHCR
ncbi:hypothetical protein QZH41_009572, partial [Actinostola sp. cb2023]